MSEHELIPLEPAFRELEQFDPGRDIPLAFTDEFCGLLPYAREIEEIATRREQLWNVWDGGEGSSKGSAKSEEQRRKISESNRKTWTDPQLLAEHSARCKVVLLRPEVRALIKKPKSPEHNQKVSDKAKARWTDPVFCEKMDRVNRDPTSRQRRSVSAKRGWITRRTVK